MRMRNIKISFHHRNYIFKFKVDLNVADNSNMFSMDPRKINESFAHHMQDLILTEEEHNVIASLPLAFKQQFVKKSAETLEARKQIDYLGSSVEEHIKYFQLDSNAHYTFHLKKCKQLYIYLCRNSLQIDLYARMKSKLNSCRTYQNLYQISKCVLKSTEQQKYNYYVFLWCMNSNIAKILDFEKLQGNDKLPAIQCINKIIMVGWAKLFKLYDTAHLSGLFQIMVSILTQCLHGHKDRSWIYKQHSQQLLCTSTLKLLIDTLKPENNNFKIMQQTIVFLCLVLQKCQNINELLLFATQCINFRILTKLQHFTQSISLMKFNAKHCLYLYLPDQLTEDFGKKVIRLKQKQISQQSWQKSVKNGKLKLIQLTQQFNKFKNGKIKVKKQKDVSFKSERQRIRKESFIMTTYEEIKHKYQEGLFTLDQKNQEHLKIYNENKQLLQLTKFYQQKIKQKDKKIHQMQETVAQFVDVRKKYLKHNILRFSSKVYDIKIQQKNLKTKHTIETQVMLPNQILPPVPFLPPPPPLSTLRLSANKSLRSSKNSKDLQSLPPPPELPFLPQLLLPPPPLLPVFNLNPPPLLSKPLNRKSAEKKQIKMLNWMAVEISDVKNSFWESVQEVQFDQADVTKFFAKKEQKTQVPKIMSVAMKQKKSLLKAERAKNIEIVLKKTRLSLLTIEQAISELNEDVLTANNVDSLLNIVPTSQQFEIFAKLEINDPQQWSEADKYFTLICKISGYVQLLSSFKFKCEFQQISIHLNAKLNQFQIFFKEIENDEFLKTFLSFLLNIGNFMNQDTSRGNAYGFKLQSIQKSYILMGQDKKTSLFQYIIQIMINKKFQFPSKNYFLEKKIVSLQILKEDIKYLTKQCKNMQQCLLKGGEDDLRTPEVFLSFYIESRQKIAIFDIKYNENFKIFHRFCDFYCEKNNSEKIIKIINDFRNRAYKALLLRKVQIK